ncbi:MAG: M3 family metallopeptidase [Bacteroidaceae bacterium]|nr:M3 family metallopeptidase [Bacteroidaceae bacterium]
MNQDINPLLSENQTLHGTMPFHLIKTEHYEPAILKGMEIHNQEIEAIINQTDAPTFANTIVALEKSGALLNQVSTVFGNLLSAETNDEMQAIAERMMPQLSEHSNNITLNEKLFARIKAVYDTTDKAQLGKEEQMLLQNTFDGFIRSGANLTPEQKERFRQISAEMSVLTLRFSQNNLKETNAYELALQADQLDGLPESALHAYAQTAQEKGKEGHIVTLQAPSFIPFMKYSQHRELRQQLYMAYNTQCTHDNEYNNMEIVKKLVNLRLERAQLLGFQTAADYVLTRRMAEKSENVYNLLNQLLEAYAPTAHKEVEEVQALAKELEGDDFQLMPWDWAYYSEKLKEKKFNLNEEALRPYFELNNVIGGVFGLATRLYGISFQENKEIPVYHPDVTAYEVFDKDGSFLAVLYADFHPRAGKRSGAWMTSYKEQWKDENGNSRPHISVVMNFTKPSGDKPALLSFGEVNTFLHEFGHALHGMFANTTYQSLSGTNVYWDFVELPSQIMENFAIEKDFLNTFAKHYETGENIPEEMIQRLVDASNFNVAYACLRQLSFGLLDMAWYTRTEPFEGDVRSYEKQAWSQAQVLPNCEETCMTVQFSHIMAGGYSAGYYSYKWAEVLDADAFSLFQEKGIFNPEVANSFREHVLSKGGTEHPMTLYKRFRGQEPGIDALLKRNGILN